MPARAHPSASSARAVTGAAVRAYRHLLGLTQAQLAERLDITQGAVAQLESGVLAVSPALESTMRRRLRGGGGVISFDAYCGQLGEQRRKNLPLVGHPAATYATLTVWDWNSRFHLAADPGTLASSGVVTLRLPASHRAVAVRMPQAADGPDGWAEAEILVFAPIPLAALRPGDLCLVQRLGPVGPESLLARSGERNRHGKSGGDPRLLTPLWPAHVQPFACDGEPVEGVLRLVYRAREFPVVSAAEGVG